MANPAAAEENAVIEYALKSEYDKTGKFSEILNGTCVLRGFDDASALLNNVMITGLDVNTEYAYRVGDGKIWSDVRTFNTIDNDVDSTTKIFVLGDTQTAVGETDNINTINHFLNDENGLNDFALGIQLGDAVEEPTQYHSWQGFLGAMEVDGGAFAQTDMLHVIGNHEQFGDPSAIAANAVFGMDPDTTYYSVTYGNVYVATIDFSMEAADVQKAAEWLRKDAAASDAPWKILVMHQPPYFTNPEGGSSALHEILPAVLDEVGIDFVFSGHDHSYARTEPMIGGKPTGDPNLGTYYFICGSTGEKSYPVVNNPDFHFVQAQKDYNAIFLGIEATDNVIDVNVYDLTPDGPQPYAIIDTVHRFKHEPCADGEHSWVYRPDHADVLMCEKCLARLDKGEYSGFAKMQDTEDDQVYMISGVLQKGWFAVDNEMMHAGDDYILHEAETRDTRTCTENGHLETVCKTCGETYRGSETFAAGHKWDEDHICTVCGKHGIDIATLPYSGVSGTYILKSEGLKIRPTPVVTDGDKTLNIQNSALGRDGYLSWENYDKCGTATVIVDGRGDYYGTLRIDYRIVPDRVNNVVISNETAQGADLKWDAVPGAQQYAVCRYDFAAKQLVEVAVTKADETSITVDTLEASTAYKVCVRARVTVDGEAYDSFQYSWLDLKTLEAEAVPTTTPTDDPLPFVDVKDKNAYYYAPVAWAYSNEITTGVDDTHFVPGGECTRAQVVTFLWRAEGCPKPTITDIPFTDLKADAYYWDAVLWAYENKITLGTSATEFSPNATVTRGQFVTFLARTAEGKDMGNAETIFTDVPESGYYSGAVNWAVENGITNGQTATTFAPGENCKRGEVVTFLYRCYVEPLPALNAAK